MAYQDPYAGRYGGYQHQPQQQYGQPQYGQPQYGQQQYGQYGDPAPEFNPYTAEGQPHPTYEQGAYDNYGGGYRDDPIPEQYAPQRQGSQHSYADAPPAPFAAKSIDETSRFDPGEFTPSPRGPKTARNLRQYRLEFQGRLWTKGGGGRCFGRFFCCTFMILIFLVVTILLALVLWLRPPGINFGNVAPLTSGSPIVPTSDGININMGVNISVNNPNYFAVKFKKITAEIYYPINNTAIGNGNASSIVISSNAQTNFTFPFSIDYSTALDPDGKILLDLAEKCGVLPNTSKTNLSVNYKITLALQILFVTISPSISNTFSFACPLTASDLDDLLKGTGLGG
ncbi:hypothetical protein B0H11DRAFT_2215833 [Mycena galericulata]|nr:hypothetical protein B0H11DRAFT_2215833 [Mycena galericulata]